MKKLFISPSLFMPPLQSRVFNSKEISPINKWLAKSLVLNRNQITSTPAIICLCFCVRPSAIAGLVIFAVINSIKGVMNRRPIPHIFEKILKRIPALANFYSSTSPSRVVLAIHILATPSHSRPSVVFNGISKAMRCVAFSSELFMKAPTRSSQSSNKAGCQNNLLLSTGTPTQPCCFPIFTISLRKHLKSIEYFSRKVCELCHVNIVTLRHSNNEYLYSGAL